MRFFYYSSLKDNIKRSFEEIYKNVVLNPLENAVEKGSIRRVSFFLKLGVNVNTDLGTGKTLLGIACKNENLKMIKYLLSKGAGKQLNRIYYKSYNPIVIAVEKGNAEILECLLNNVDNPSRLDEDLIYYATERDDIPVLKTLIKHGLNLNIGRYDSPLIRAIEDGNVKRVKMLIELGANVNSIDGAYKHSPLHIAIEKGKDEIVKLLIKAGVNVNTVDGYGCTPLIHAICVSEKIPELLIEAGADINLPVDMGTTIHKKPDYVEEVVYRGIKDHIWHPTSEELEKCSIMQVGKWVYIDHMYNDLNKYGYTPLGNACAFNNLEAIKALIENGVDIPNNEIRKFILDNMDKEIIKECIPRINDPVILSIYYAKKKDLVNLKVVLNNICKIKSEPLYASSDLKQREEDIKNFGKATEYNMKLINEAKKNIEFIDNSLVLDGIRREIENDNKTINKLPKNLSDDKVNKERETILLRLELNKNIISIIRNTYRETEKIVETVLNAVNFTKNLKKGKIIKIPKENTNNREYDNILKKQN